ncbi:carboxypeptidase-like regulatory domain-containing protein [Alicyclobacillus macrosporangiidus]|uniref:carboxypeptidase-like regulatory domain-containing protein n=1 Tax=Alicyclobacillus macrosporangiidus TaxID=392015 RepID=UPI000497B91B|nr:carboxypeptidase-like regulatory domain-containing protein [Alicyclobacillus macrosporangiidus]
MRHLSWDEVWEWVQGAELPAAKRSHAGVCPVCAERMRRCEQLHRALVCTLTAGVGVTAGDDDALLAFLRQEAGMLPAPVQAAGAFAGAVVGSVTSSGVGSVTGSIAGSVEGSRTGRANRARRRWTRAVVGIGAAACAAAGVSWPSLHARWTHQMDDAGSTVAVAAAGLDGAALGAASDAGLVANGPASRGGAEGTAGGRHAAGRSGQGASAGSTAAATSTAADGTGAVGETAGGLSAAAPAAHVAGESGSAGTVTRRATQSASSDGGGESASWVQTAGSIGERPSSTGAAAAPSAGARAADAPTVASQSMQKAGPARVQGRVQVRASDGKVLSGATVTLSAGGRVLATARTLGDGWTPVLSFTAPADPMLSSSTPSASEAPGVAVVTVECPGYRPAVVYEVGLADGAWIAPVVTLESITPVTPNPVRPNPIPVTSTSSTFQA